MPDISREEAIKANIEVHSSLANAGEYQKSPHFRPENIEKVRKILERVTSTLRDPSTAKAIDFGCGTGFIIDLVKHQFAEVHGVDVTKDMMKFVDTSSGNVFLHESTAEDTPFGNETFEFAAAYSFMDHLLDYKVFLGEVYRVLKPGGVFFSDLNPNRDFITAMASAESGSIEVDSALVAREIQGALHNGQYYQDNFGLNPDSLDKAEPIKSKDKGFQANEVYQVALDLGFSEINIEYEWFLGQGKVMHEESLEKANSIDAYLNTIVPISSPLYKYLRFVFVK